MPHLGGSARLTAYDTARTPIPGNDSLGGACHDPSTGEALWGVVHNGEVQVWRTRDGYQSLLTQDASVDYLATIVGGSWVKNNVALQRIGGTLYAHVAGKNLAGLVAGQWLYRDTSPAQDGTGPWVLHGTLNEIAIGATSTEHHAGGNTGGEILVLDGGTWVANVNYFSVLNSTTTATRQGVMTSTDGGVSWTKRLDVGWYLGGGIYGERWSRNFAKINGAWYVGGSGIGGPGQHYKSTDGVTWSSIGSLGYGQSFGTAFPISTNTHIYRFTWSGDRPTGIAAATAPPETLPPYGDEIAIPLPDVGRAFHLVCNIGPGAAPLWVVTYWGQVLGLKFAGSLHPCRQWPRADGLAASSARRRYPIDKSEQASPRRAGHYW